MWTVKIDKSVYKRLNRIPNPDKRRILQALFDLEDKPEQLDIKPLVNRDCYRLRVGDWRLIMDMDLEEKIISVYMLGSRGDVYK